MVIEKDDLRLLSTDPVHGSFSNTYCPPKYIDNYFQRFNPIVLKDSNSIFKVDYCDLDNLAEWNLYWITRDAW